jgi:hypothetical protein
MSVRGLAIGACVACACTSVPDFHPDNGLSWESQGTGGFVRGSMGGPFALHFADGEGFHFPDALTIGGMSLNLVGHSESTGCGFEDRIGVALFPAHRISAEAESSVGVLTNDLNVSLRGPAVVQVRLDWKATLPCGGQQASLTPSGVSIFTVFPDGHIVRYDEVTESDHPSADPKTCFCNSMNNVFVVTAFWTVPLFNPVMLRDGTNAMVTTQPTRTPGQEWNITSSRAGCALGSMLEIGFAAEAPRNIRMRTPSTDTLAFVANLAEGSGAGSAGSPLGLVEGVHASSLLAVQQASQCQSVLQLANAFTMHPTLTINDAPASFGRIEGIYGGHDDLVNSAGLDVNGSRAVLKGVVPRFFGVWLRFDREYGALRAEKNGQGVPDRNWYIAQRTDDPRAWIVWFADELAADQTFTLEGVE